MLTVEQAAKQLSVTQARVRKMISDGVLPAEKFGRNWMILNTDVIKRAEQNPGRGRPKKNSTWSNSSTTPSAVVIQYLYLECKENLSKGYDINSILSLPTREEREFCIVLTDFFLQQKQRELIDRGVY